MSAAPNGAASSEADKIKTRKHWEPLSLELKGAMESRWPNAQEPADAALLAGALRDAAVGLPASVDRDAVVREAAERWMRSRAWRKSMDKPAAIFRIEVGDIAAAVAKTPELNLADLDGIMSRGVIRNMDEGVRALRYWHMDEGGENYQSWGGWLNSSDSAKLDTIIEAYEDLDALRERYRASLVPVSREPAPEPEPAPDPVAPTAEKSSPEEPATMITRKVSNQVRLEEAPPDPARSARSAEWKRILQAGGGRRPKVDLVKRKPLPLYQPVPLPPRKLYTAS